MPSSISNFDNRPLAGPWLRIWAVSLLLTAAALGTLELLWFENGVVPTVTDDVFLWSQLRARVYGAPLQTVVLLGASRMQLDFSVAEFEREFPSRPIVQLAIDGRSAMAVLRDLAADRQFVGTVICEANERSLEPANWQAQDEYVRAYHKRFGINAAVNRAAETWLQTHLRLAAPQLNLLTLARQAMWREPLHLKNYIVTFPDRSREAHFELVDRTAIRDMRRRIATSDARTPSSSPEAWRNAVDEIDQWVQDISSRGGRVMFVRFPTSGVVLDLDEHSYPRARYWDVFAATVHATTVHFADDAALRAFDPPDESHLDASDKDAFTRVLLRKLEENGPF